MKFIAKLILWPAVLIPLLLVGAAMLAIEDQPKLHNRAMLSPEQIARGKFILQQNDPRNMTSGAVTRTSLLQQDLDLAINYLTNQYADGVSHLHINRDKAILETSLPLPDNPFGQFLNIKLELKQSQGYPEINNLSLGELRLPGLLVNGMVKLSLAATQPLIDWQSVTNMIKQVKFEPQRLTVTYRWHDNLPGKLSDLLLSEQEQQRIEAYQRRLAELTNAGTDGLSLTDLTKPLFQLAVQRSVTGEAAAENRALILVLTFYANQKDFNKIISRSKTWPHPTWRTVTLNDRDDFTKHYLVSAMLAAYAGTPLSYVVGLYKEIADSQGGSGFSFNDIAADRAGTRMGELAIASESQAKKIQQFMATSAERDMMPITDDLPEFMAESEFRRRFGGIQGQAYQTMMAKIEQRIAGLPINQ